VHAPEDLEWSSDLLSRKPQLFREFTSGKIDVFATAAMTAEVLLETCGVKVKLTRGDAHLAAAIQRLFISMASAAKEAAGSGA
jgi:hypothetical protein